MTPALAERLARIALSHVTREYPHKLDHVLGSDADAATPRALHPIFFGSYDWHSCVHTHWTLLRLARLHPDLPFAADVRRLAADSYTAEKVEAERAYLDRPNTESFERPYGWAWTLALHGEAALGEHGAALEPLARAFAARFAAHLPKLTYPIRAGTHGNTAFACLLALDWADAHDPALAALIRTRAGDWYGEDRDCPGWEPGGDEFLSAALVEALLVARALAPDARGEWLARFLPGLAEGRPAPLFVQAHVSDRADPKIAHLDGFNLTRAWCWRSLAPLLAPPAAARALDAAEAHLAASLPHLDDDYMGAHWLASFALLALTA
ncbi:DUF2891 domain-containing protein [Sphingomonas jatrophae]|uniref:DUF2891 domain-containing protein n=1 Tax=Sphingomonas jatrophae TaxID=1166337 RepID=A0A1I6JVY0_9SPHN|nr:DUF2891 domain-containing protein [Sphingomonas jatrophae]SFR83107.1 Protein of unknown function [Sphingomonas jatrophae]